MNIDQHLKATGLDQPLVVTPESPKAPAMCHLLWVVGGLDLAGSTIAALILSSDHARPDVGGWLGAGIMINGLTTSVIMFGLAEILKRVAASLNETKS